MNFADRLLEAVRRKKSVVCVGLDPDLARIPEEVRGGLSDWEAVLEFNKGIIDAVKDIVPVVKPQVAFYEALGPEGMKIFQETCRYAKDQGLLVLGDVKRGDIGSTAEAYAKAYLEADSPFPVDAITVNAYLGADGVTPFVKAAEKSGKGIFVLVKTSNLSSGDLQDRVTEGEKMSIAALMGHFVEAWGSDSIGESGYSCVGAVVGATYPKEAILLRKIMPTAIFLVPGYGAQGGSAEDVRPCFDANGFGAIVNNSRGILYAYEKGGGDYKTAAREEAIKMNAELNRVRGVA